MISFGAVIGRATPFQLLAMTIVEIILFGLNEFLWAKEVFQAVDMGGTVFIHTFGAYFGLAVSMALEKRPVDKRTDETADENNSSRCSALLVPPRCDHRRCRRCCFC